MAMGRAGLQDLNSTLLNSATATAAESEWKVRPRGMLVQKRNPDPKQKQNGEMEAKGNS
ncbi:hypothetical protein LguiB_025374 [Lonicera macranthoides]